jgi:hypothetical protein
LKDEVLLLGGSMGCCQLLLLVPMGLLLLQEGCYTPLR